MLVGQPPFGSEGFGDLVKMHLSVSPASARSKPRRWSWRRTTRARQEKRRPSLPCRHDPALGTQISAADLQGSRSSRGSRTRPSRDACDAGSGRGRDESSGRSVSQVSKISAVGESRTPTIVRSPEPESESLHFPRRELAPWRGQLPHGVTERHAPPRPSGGKRGADGGSLARERVSGVGHGRPLREVAGLVPGSRPRNCNVCR